jgi:tetratricopeptide (TPR) repeat protein
MIKSFWVGVFLLISTQAWAVLPYAATPAEEAMCAAKGMPAGQGFQGHYCGGLRYLDRAYSSMGNKRDMMYYLDVAINNFDYMLGHTKEDDVRRGEFHVGKARALKLMGRKAEAAAEFNKALSYKISSPDVYMALSDFFHETGNKKKALEMATEGLKSYPASKGLERRYTEFGGKLPYPVAAIEEAIRVEETKAENAAEAKSDAAPPSDAQTVQSSDINDETTPTSTPPQIEPVKIGTPKNPYCRFCPE